MKYFRIFLGICMAACLGFLIVNTKPPADWQGETSEALRQFCNVKQAEALNSAKISVYMDETEVLSDQSRKLLYMSDRLELMASPEALARLLNVTVSFSGGDQYLVSDGKRTYAFEPGNDYVTEAGDTFLFPGSAEKKNDHVFIALQAVCLAFEHGYSFDMENRCARIVRTDTVSPALPKFYDMRTESKVPAVGSQGNLGTCWAFASIAALESSLMPEENLRFSVDHLSMNSGFNVGQNDGGDYFMALSYLTSWKGPVYEADDPYGDGRTDTSLLAVKHLQEAVKVASKDYDMIKRMVYTKGAVQSSFYSDIEVSNVSSDYYNMQTSAYFYDGDAAANHDIVIVGWDDDYPRENFNKMPENDGAFLCQNSWGSDFGRDGYFYISYEDTNIGVYNMVYTSVEPADNYDYIYQSDGLGWLGNIGYNEPSAWFANVYTALGRQNLSAVSFYATDQDTYYEVYAVPEYTTQDSLNDAVFMQSGYLEDAGYYTVKFDEEIPVSGRFAVMVYIDTKNAVHPIAIEYEGGQISADVDLSDGYGYISHDRSQWQRSEENYSCNICLKAFTNDLKKK
ncbi:MAG: lectin like domain-containing protein [Clostridiales bacterium]|nr:lectin like domain-containing protein [Clostridiales bacterium]